jgi:hypothetical protein
VRASAPSAALLASIRISFRRVIDVSGVRQVVTPIEPIGPPCARRFLKSSLPKPAAISPILKIARYYMHLWSQAASAFSLRYPSA